MAFSEKIVAFVDILGFKRMVASAEAGGAPSLEEVLSYAAMLGSRDDSERIRKGGVWCPQSPRVASHLDFELTQVSDCVVVSAEVSPVGVINVVSHCWDAAMRLLQRGVACRGYITRGMVHHADGQFVGTGYQQAYKQEAQVTAFKRGADERGTPFIEVDAAVVQYVATCGDPCVREMFGRYVATDGKVVALFPFKRIAHSFMIGGFGSTFDADRERAANQNVRALLHTLKARVDANIDRSNPSAIRKAQHYLAALDAQLDVCAKTDEVLTKLSAPVGGIRHRGPPA